MPQGKVSSIRRKLLRWYSNNCRDLPWRRTPDPYAIWIAETMLQQTQVATVVRYYERFLENFPTVEALARAPLAKILALWSGLGYYRRARYLKDAARLLVRQHAGILPSDYDCLLALPGVGAYTAGALMSIAFHKPYPAIDGNADRVLGRLFGLSGQKRIRAVATRLVSRSHPGQFNQALMELGASVCTPSAPGCTGCPVADHCAAPPSGEARRTRAAKIRRASKRVTWPIAVVRRRGKILLRRRPDGGILAGLWELPGGALAGTPRVRESLERHLRELNGHLGFPRRVGALRHAITHRRIDAPIFLFDVDAATKLRLPKAGWRWVAPSSLREYPISSMTSKALKILHAREKNRL